MSNEVARQRRVAEMLYFPNVPSYTPSRNRQAERGMAARVEATGSSAFGGAFFWWLVWGTVGAALPISLIAGLGLAFHGLSAGDLVHSGELFLVGVVLIAPNFRLMTDGALQLHPTSVRRYRDVVHVMILFSFLGLVGGVTLWIVIKVKALPGAEGGPVPPKITVVLGTVYLTLSLLAGAAVAGVQATIAASKGD
jgi:hypothetical protein